MQADFSALRELVSNGQTVIFGVLIAALVGATVLGALHDISSDAVVAIYSSIIGGGIGHLSGRAAAKRDAEIERLKATSSIAKSGSKR
jgi:hypothetical protein